MYGKLHFLLIVAVPFGFWDFGFWDLELGMQNILSLFSESLITLICN
jgi:hypothetical protein